MIRVTALAAAAALSVAVASSASAGVVNFNDLPAGGWWNSTPANDQSVNVPADYATGLPDGVTATWSGLKVGYMGGDQGGGGRFIQTTHGTGTMGTVTFSAPVNVQSLFVDTEWGVGKTAVRAYTNVDDTTPVLTFARPANEGRPGSGTTNWVEVTTFANTPIQKLVISDTSWPAVFVDTMTVTAVPEPGTLGVLGLGAVAMLYRRRK